MSAIIIDGTAIAKQVLAEQKIIAGQLTARGNAPGLAVLLVGDDPASAVYVRSKERACRESGVQTFDTRLPADTSEADLLKHVDALNNDPKVHGILVQLPLPAHMDGHKVIEAISPAKDVDGFHTLNLGKVAQEDPTGFVACTPAGIMELLARSHVDLVGKHVVVLGRSLIVGKPVALLALRHTYGRGDIVADGPRFARMEPVAGALRLHFTNIDGGLVTRGPLAGFALAGPDRVWHWAEARLEGGTVVVSSPAVPEPVAVRYAWQANPPAPLFNGAGLPAAPFRTDDWPLSNP